MKSLDRAIDILFSFSRNKTDQTPAEIAEATGIPITSIYRFLKTFEKKGLMEQDGRTGRYSLGYDLLSLESAVRNKIGLDQITKPIIEKIAKITEETVQVTILNKDHGMLLFSVESPVPPRFVPEYGFPMPLYAGCTVQVMMAYLPIEQQQDILSGEIRKFGPNSLLRAEEILAKLETIKTEGYAVSLEEFYPGSKGLSVPFFGGEGRVLGSLSISAPLERFDERKEEEFLGLLREEAGIISQRIAAQDNYSIS